MTNAKTSFCCPNAGLLGKQDAIILQEEVSKLHLRSILLLNLSIFGFRT